MGRKAHVKTLEKKYARMKGIYFSIEKECEELEGESLIDKWKEIENRQKKIIQKMNSIKEVIRLEEPEWDSDKIKAIAPRKDHGLRGYLSESVYEFLWSTDGDFTVTEAYKEIMAILFKKGKGSYSPKYIRDQVTVFLLRLEGDLVERLDGKPTRWRVK